MIQPVNRWRPNIASTVHTAPPPLSKRGTGEAELQDEQIQKP